MAKEWLYPNGSGALKLGRRQGFDSPPLALPKTNKYGKGIIQIKTSGNHRANPFDEVSPSSAANGKGKTENDSEARRRAERNGLGRRIHRIIK